MITPMKKVLLAGRQKNRGEILSTLRDCGAVHIEPTSPGTPREDAELAKKIIGAFQAIEGLGQVKPAKEGASLSGGQVATDEIVSPRKGVTPERAMNACHLIEDSRQVSERLSECQKVMTKLRQEQQTVSPWGRIVSGDLEALRYQGLKIGFFICPVSLIDTVQADIRQIIANIDGQAYVVAVSRGMLVAGSGVIEIKRPERDAAEIEAELAKVALEYDGGLAVLARLAVRLPEIRDYHLELLEKKKQNEVESCLLESNPIFVLQGWVPEPCTE